MRLKHINVSSLHVLLIAAILLGGLALTGCSSDEHPAAETAMLPDYVQSAPVTVREAYQYAIAHPDILAYQPCYCGCGGMGHTSNLDCFIQETASDGTIIFDNHAAGCGICVDIAQDVMRLMDEDMPQGEIRTYIDAKYSTFGPSTDTPFPPQL